MSTKASEFFLALDSASPELAAKLEQANESQRDFVVFEAVKSALHSAEISEPDVSEALLHLRKREEVPAALALVLEKKATEAARRYAEALAPEDSDEVDSPDAETLFSQRLALEAITSASQGHRAIAISQALMATGMQPGNISRLIGLL